MIVKIGAKEIEMTSSALTSLAYKKLFGQDILAIIGGFKGADRESGKAYDALDTVVQLGFIMAMQASKPINEFMKLNEIDFYEWVNKFKYTELYQSEVVDQILDVWSQNLNTGITGKNAKGEAAGR